ncbi:flagellar biosynthesis protein FlgA [Corynebacterium sp. FDAARGOS 1242]|uniref:Putative secreted protein n=1 Tax=Corynebacterium minutissimum TaxID=38301 RepID=A0A376CW25_9CORY|nr:MULTISPECIES: SAF domain-containing protein [Corynebacterium]QRP60512.1 flagellar biosynthesis protein FlgA [Corynebacterium minutissimum]QRP96977.1 flagellar biosynthesis protein FlgA [Corynebacterium sp. FDAARGOS 1242]STC76111.1 putative secreted protein [Corynebacterium minutissimum]
MDFLQLLRTPGHRRSVLLRRVLACVLLVAAGLSAVASTREHPHTVVMAREVSAGEKLTRDDVSLARVPSSLLPATAVGSNPEDVVGRVLLASASPGEILTTTRLLSSDLIADFGMEDAHLIPLTLAEPEIASNLHHGDTVNIVGGSSTGEAEALDVEFSAVHGPTIASGARVISVGTTDDGARGRTLLVALPADAAEAVAAASLAQPLTVVIVGDRAHS